MASATTQARAPTFFDDVVAATPGEEHLALCIQCGDLRWFMPFRSRYGSHPARPFCVDFEWNEETSLKEQHPLVLCFLLLLYGALSATDPYHRHHVYT